VTDPPGLLRRARAMSETELQEDIRVLCKHHGLAVQHLTDPRRAWLSGWPDLVIIGTAVLFVELKKEGEGLSPDQRDVRHRLIAAGQQFRLWQPKDLLRGTIHAELQAISRVTL